MFHDLMVENPKDLRLKLEDKTDINRPETWTMSEIDFNCACLSYDMKSKRTLYFSSTMKETENVLIIDAILSTSAAPTYFPIPDPYKVITQDKGKDFTMELYCVDGGVWANDPTFAAHFSQSYRLSRHRHMIYQIISFGTGNKKNEAPKTTFQNALSWVLGSDPIFDVMMDSTTANVETMLKYFIKTGHVVFSKIQYELTKEIKLDDTHSIPDQKKLVDDQFDENNGSSKMRIALDDAVRLTMLMGWKENGYKDSTHINN